MKKFLTKIILFFFFSNILFFMHSQKKIFSSTDERSRSSRNLVVRVDQIIANKFPKLEIIAGLTPKKPDYTSLLLKAGANTLTKFPAIRKFGSKEAYLIEKQIKDSGRKFTTSLTELPQIDWKKEVKKH